MVMERPRARRWLTVVPEPVGPVLRRRGTGATGAPVHQLHLAVTANEITVTCRCLRRDPLRGPGGLAVQRRWTWPEVRHIYQTHVRGESA